MDKLKRDNAGLIERIYGLRRELDHYKHVGPIREDQRTTDELRDSLEANKKQLTMEKAKNLDMRAKYMAEINKGHDNRKLNGQVKDLIAQMVDYEELKKFKEEYHGDLKRCHQRVVEARA